MMSGHLVAGVDGSALASVAVEWAAEDARRRGRALRIVHVRDAWPYNGDLAGYGTEILDDAAERARKAAPGLDVATRSLCGNVVDVLIEESAPADGVVLGSRGLGGFAGLVMGSVGLGVAGHAAGPVVIVRGPATERYGLVVAGYDGSAHAETALRYAVEQARARDARLHVVHACREPVYTPYSGVSYQSVVRDAWKEAARAVAERMAQWREENPDVRITSEQVGDHPVSALAAAGAAADLVVVGSRGLGGFASAVFGSVSHGVLHHVTCPVAVVRPRA